MQQENSEFVPKGRPVDNTREALHVLYSKLVFTLYFYAHGWRESEWITE